MDKATTTKGLSQHQKRINIIEILYQYFLEPDQQKNFENYLITIATQKNQSQIATIKDILWYKTDLIQEIEKHLKTNWTFNSLKATEKAILILATYEILYTKTDKAIIINEAIILAKQYCDNNVYKYINGVLDKINN
ncbi:MAG: transcription antitermination factor NusB [Spiroplasma sp.]|nr:transcription antitermination factor NusB [Spiroplasma sp.]